MLSTSPWLPVSLSSAHVQTMEQGYGTVVGSCAVEVFWELLAKLSVRHWMARSKADGVLGPPLWHVTRWGTLTSPVHRVAKASLCSQQPCGSEPLPCSTCAPSSPNS